MKSIPTEIIICFLIINCKTFRRGLTSKKKLKTVIKEKSSISQSWGNTTDIRFGFLGIIYVSYTSETKTLIYRKELA